MKFKNLVDDDRRRALRRAVERGELAKLLKRNGPQKGEAIALDDGRRRLPGELNSLDSQLLEAVKKADYNAVKDALDKGADVDAADGMRFTALTLASNAGSLEIVRLLVERKAKLDTMSDAILRALDIAAFLGYKDIVETLLNAGASIDHDDRIGGPLLAAVVKGHSEIAKLLIERGADFNARDMDANTPLRIAVEEGLDEVAEMLRKLGAKG